MIKISPLKLTLLLISMLTIMAGTPVAPTLPKMAEAFAGQPQAELLTRLVLTMPALFTVFGAPMAGVIADRFGRKPLLMAALVLYTVAGVSGYFGQNLYQILVGRAFLGLAVGGCYTAATTLIGDYYFGRERADLLGFQAAFTTAGGVVFISLGGYLAELGWRFPFLIYVMGAGVFILALWNIREPVRDRKPAHPDGRGGVPWGLFSMIYMVALIGHIGFFAVPVQMPFYLQREFGIGGVGTGLVLSLATVFATLTGFNYGRIRSHLSYGATFAAMFGFMGVSYVIVGFAPSVWILLPGLCLTGIAAGMLIPTMNNWISDITDDHSRGRALGILTTAIFLGQFLTPVVTEPLVTATPSYGTFFWVLGFILLGLCLLVAPLGAALNRRTGLLVARHDVQS